LDILPHDFYILPAYKKTPWRCQYECLHPSEDTTGPDAAGIRTAAFRKERRPFDRRVK